MGLGVSFKIAPGVRVRASSRGVRASVGPRAARVHVGAGRTSISTGAGPVTLSTTLGGSTRRTPSRATSVSTTGASPRPRQPTVAQLQPQARAAERAQQVAEVAALERCLTTLHHVAFPESTRHVLPTPATPTPAEIEAVRRELYRTATVCVPIWRRADRKRAKGWANDQAPAETQRRHTGALVSVQWEQSQFDQDWDALRNHDPFTVIKAVDDAFADNASDSTCVDAGTAPESGARYVTAVVTYGDIDLIPEHRADRTPGGKPTLRKRTKTDRNALFAASLASTVLATAKEALAVAVAATEARVLVVRPDGTGDVEPIYAGTLRRDFLANRDWPSVDPLAVAMAAEDAEMRHKGSTREVVGLAVEPNSPAADLIEAWSQAVPEHE
ncbi:DUF4236 domain-containing protein [Terrabacter sp. RAF57]|uniref:DUF4236 domain-containing protein n=1 Tax=Terrabacter sp. RAF57 TaxID=3233063 RepID=UPI003F9C4BB5